jgi:tetratricopeptide (TPR) repeat protein
MAISALVSAAQQDPSDLLSKAITAESSASAVQVCDLILAQDRRHLPAMELRSKALWREGSYEAALMQINEACALNPYDPGYYFLKADCLQNLGRVKEAIDAYGHAESCGDLRIASESRARIAELQQWQNALVGDLLRHDAEFRSHYVRDPLAALSSHGLSMHSGQAKAVVLLRQALPTLWARPS